MAATVVPNRISVQSVALRDKGKRVELMPVVKKLSRQHSQSAPDHVDYQDVVAAGLLGLAIARDRFKRNRGAKLSSYAFTRINGEIKDMLRRERIYATRYQLEDNFDGSGLARSVSYEAAFVQRDLFFKVCELISELPVVQARIIQQYYLEEKSGKEIAAELGISVGAVDKLRTSALEAVRIRFQLLNPSRQKAWVG